MPWEEPYPREVTGDHRSRAAVPVTLDHLARFEADEPFVLA
ncbi:hypothetical protein [Actinoplanes sichuanensis]|uniref:Uncharacterized protein n=1 Tax=Actinoplanes sichuanensis TaxID=512349 RepID=A0ABW4ADA5_9ACTN|nr:hypothetical protein [Actinoplanes sichuanensis]